MYYSKCKPCTRTAVSYNSRQGLLLLQSVMPHGPHHEYSTVQWTETSIYIQYLQPVLKVKGTLSATGCKSLLGPDFSRNQCWSTSMKRSVCTDGKKHLCDQLLLTVCCWSTSLHLSNFELPFQQGHQLPF